MNSRDRYLARASRTYHEQFLNGAGSSPSVINAGRKYLSNHGIGTRQVAVKYQLGVVIEPLQGDEFFTGMLVFPYLTPNGVRGIKFRRLDDRQPKNMQHAGQPARLYNSRAYFDAGEKIGIAEGEADAIAATERLGIPTVGVPGAEAWTARRQVWTPVFKNFTRVLIFTDGDPVNKQTGLRPGEEMGKAIAESLGWRARIVKSPEGQDVSSMVAAGRIEELTKQFGDDDE